MIYRDIYTDKEIEWAFTTTPADNNGVCHVHLRVIYEPKDFTSFPTMEVCIVSILVYGNLLKRPYKLLARWCLEEWDRDSVNTERTYDARHFS